MTDAIGGHLPIVIVSLVAALPHVQSGKLRAIAVSSTKRWESLPNVPTVAEAGLGGYSHRTWLGLFVPRGTPEPRIERIHNSVSMILQSPEIKNKVSQMGATAGGGSRTEFQESIHAEYVQSRDLIRDLRLMSE
jgi:tripartite-type tricarboxylate transporter receptor subunit TctC